jgi:hypothetical protein
MLVVIGLGMLHFGITPGSELKLLFLPTENIAESDVDTTALADLDVALQAEPMPIATAEDSSAPLPTKELLTSLDVDWSDVISADSGVSSLMPAIGTDALGANSSTHSVASLFGLSGEGGKFVYVFDRSGSMNSMFTLYSEGRILSMITPLRSAKRELIRSLQALSPANEFQIVFYNSEPEIFGDSHYSHELFRATAENKQLATSFVEGMLARGFTNHLLALEAAFTLDPDVIFLLTDGEAKDDLHPTVIRRMYKYCQRRNIVVNVVHFCNKPRDECTLIPLAQRTGGQHIFISLESLAEATIDPVSLSSF